MPFDQKRINGPETSFSYKQFVESEEKSKPTGFKEKRADGRKWDENRKLGEIDLLRFTRYHFLTVSLLKPFSSMPSQKLKDLATLRMETPKYCVLFLNCAKFQESTNTRKK